jgi:hypothetical protein
MAARFVEFTAGIEPPHPGAECCGSMPLSIELNSRGGAGMLRA